MGMRTAASRRDQDVPSTRLTAQPRWPPGWHGEALYRYALHLAGNRDEALDLVQSTYERALRRGFRGVGPQHSPSWLFTIAHNHFIDRRRQTARWKPLEDWTPASEPMAFVDGEEADSEDERQSKWRAFTLADLQASVDRLTPALGDTFRLHVFERLSYAAVAQRLHIRVSTVGTRLVRARLRLRSILAEVLPRVAAQAPLQDTETTCQRAA
jgi:RNA polymerase sigma-70 factor, ECF subfamily